MKNTLRGACTIAQVIGMGAIVYGVWRWSIAAACIVGGVLVLVSAELVNRIIGDSA